MGLIINEAKTKYMLMARHAPIMNDLVVGPYTFERVDDFKYLGVNINHKNDMHNEIKLRNARKQVTHFRTICLPRIGQ